MATLTSLHTVCAEYIGIQHMPGYGSFELYNIMEDLPGHPKGSTLSWQTLINEGYYPLDYVAPCTKCHGLMIARYDLDLTPSQYHACVNCSARRYPRA
jgi:hypothetical protein